MGLTDVGGIPVIQSGGGNGNDMWGGSGILGIILIIALLGGNGFGGFGGRNAAAATGVDNTVWEAQNFQRLESGHTAIQSQLNGLGQGICDSTFALNNSIKDGFYSNAMAAQQGFSSIGNALCATTYELSTAIKDCCCNTQRAIDGVNFNAERNTMTIVQANNANTQRLLDFLVCDKLEDKNAKIAEQAQMLSEQRITGTIMQTLQPPRPIPAYHVPSPYAQYGNNCFPC